MKLNADRVLFQFHIYGFSFSNTWKCVKDSDSEITELHSVMWFFIVRRILGLSETIFFIVRKKKNQLSFLHVYHHVSSILIFWNFFKYSGGMMEVFIVVISELVHIVKHIYYLFSSYTNVTQLFRLLMFIKPITVALQIIELVLILKHSIVAVGADCNLTSLFYLQIVNVVFLVVLYAKFFMKCYMRTHNIKY